MPPLTRMRRGHFWRSPDPALQGANLTGANLHGTNLTGVILEKTVLIGARLNSANLKDAQYLTQEQLDSTAAGNAKTVLPQRVRPPAHWSA
jgi:uncharacterized protein YjbI with pentapeptide repeats